MYRRRTHWNGDICIVSTRKARGKVLYPIKIIERLLVINFAAVQQILH